MNVRLVDNEELKQNIFNSAEKIEKLSNSREFVYKNNFISNKTLTIFRNTLSSAGVSKILENVILEYAYKSELASSCSSDLFFSILPELLKNENTDKLEDNLKLLKEELSNISKPFNEESFCLLSSETINNKKIISIAHEAIKLAGVDGKITPSKSISEHNSIELQTGYNFNVSPYIEFLKNDIWKYDNVKVLIVDGVVETVSEINHILTDAYETKEPVLVLARGFGEEVIATLATNFYRKTLNILPIRVPYEVELVNIISDVAVCAGVDPVTPFKGDLLVNKKFSDLPIVDSISASKESLSILNEKTKGAVYKHIIDLEKRKDSITELALMDILNKRLSSFSARTVEIRLFNKTEAEHLRELEDLDYIMRLHKSIFDNGIVYLDTINLGYSELINNCINKMKIYKIKPTMSVYSAFYYAIKLINLISSTKVALITE